MISSGAPERQPVRRHEHRDAARLEHPGDLGEHALGIRDVLERLHGQHRREAAVRERQRAHVRHHRLAVLAGERLRVEIDADRLARREQVEAVADAAAEVQHAARPELRLGQRVGRDVALPGRD